MDFYVSKSTTVNIAFQDLSKAFDKVNHNILFRKLMQRNVPGVLVKLLHSWYGCFQLSLDGARTSLVHFRYNVVLDKVVYYPVLFAVYIDGIIDKL